MPWKGICLLSAGGGFSTNPPVIAMGMRQYYGLFRIDNQYFCSDGTIATRNVCNMPCQHLCAADQSSKLDTFYYENIDGVPRYGIFQLSGLEWCDNGRHSSQNKCHTLCDNFLDDNITDDALCVKTIVNSTKDMTAWPLYEKYCDEGRVNRYYIKCLFGGVTQRRKFLLRNLP
ncbi:lysozyme C, milk isozyme-like [Podarcis muralis]